MPSLNVAFVYIQEMSLKSGTSLGVEFVRFELSCFKYTYSEQSGNSKLAFIENILDTMYLNVLSSQCGARKALNVFLQQLIYMLAIS